MASSPSRTRSRPGRAPAWPARTRAELLPVRRSIWPSCARNSALSKPEIGGRGAPRPANRRGAARLGAVQALYQMDVGGATLPAVVAEVEAHRLGRELEGEQLLPADFAFFRLLVGGVVEAQRRIDPIVDAALPPTWPLTRVDLTLRAILRCGSSSLRNATTSPRGWSSLNTW